MRETRTMLGDDVDPDIREFQRITSADYARLSTGDASAISNRQVAEEVRRRWRSGGPEMAETINLKTASDVRIRIYTPIAANSGRALVYLHGGGWVMFSIDTHDRLMREYASRSQTVVIGVDYSLAPESCYPRALDEVSDVVEWIADGGLGNKYENSAIIVGGDSAGANLAIAATMRARDEGRRIPDGLLLNYGAYDSEVRESYYRFDGSNYMLTCAEMAVFWDAYLRDAKSGDCQYARPLRVSADGLPPTYMCVAACDILFDENKEMALRLRNAGVQVTENVYAGATHSFLEAVSISSLASQAFDDASQWLRKNF